MQTFCRCRDSVYIRLDSGTRTKDFLHSKRLNQETIWLTLIPVLELEQDGKRQTERSLRSIQETEAINECLVA